MAFVVGAYARTAAARLGPAACAVAPGTQIGPTDSAGFACTARLQLAWVTLDGSVGVPIEEENGSLSLLWGSLYRDGHDDASNRALLRTESGSDSPQFEAISGEFGYAVHDAATDTLRLVTDKFGKRALFVYCAEDRVWFSSSLKVMERLPRLQGEEHAIRPGAS